jgi:mannose-6-phosphate isomerase
VEIKDLFSLNPERFLGHSHLSVFGSQSERYQTEMAFLLKLLSVDKAISIQAHPNQTLSEKLHAARPDIYRDETHKPEIGVALDDNVASCFGFLGREKLSANMNENKVLGEYFEYEHGSTVCDETYLKKAIHKLLFELDKDQSLLEKTLCELEAEISHLSAERRTEHQKLFLTLVAQYGRDDVGLIFIFFFNILRLKKGEALLSIPDEPHAYLSGDIVECMCNSDNTVRGGLTPKFKDTDILYDMLPYHNMEIERRPFNGIPL